MFDEIIPFNTGPEGVYMKYSHTGPDRVRINFHSSEISTRSDRISISSNTIKGVSGVFI